MTDPVPALDELIAALDAAVEDGRAPVKSMSTLVAWSQRRLAVHEHLRALERSARVALQRADDGARGLEDPLTLDRLAPEVADAVRSRLERVRTLARLLGEHDSRRMVLMTRMRGLMRAYVTAVCPPTQAYGRNGALGGAALPSSWRRSA